MRLFLGLLVMFAACGVAPSEARPAPADGQAGMVTANAVTKVLVFIEENHSYSQMKAGMPYAYSLAAQYGYATHYYAVTHPSLPNYIAIASGSTYNISDDSSPDSHRLTGKSVFDQALDAGRTAKVYAQAMPSNCYRRSAAPYVVRHNPWAYFTDSQTRCNSNDVSTTQLAADVTNGRLPNVGMVIPDLNHDAHDGSLASADTWFKSQMTSIFAGPDWQSGHLAVVLTADEDDKSANNNVLAVVIHPSQAHNVVSTSLNHYSLTRLLQQVGHASTYLNKAAGAPDIATAFGLPIG
jgi:acid phosphatase